MGAQTFPDPNIFEHVERIVCLAWHDPALGGLGTLMRSMSGNKSMRGEGEWFVAYQTTRNVTPEDVNVHDMQSVRVTLAEDWVSIDDPRICGGGKELRCRHSPAHERHRPFPLSYSHVVGNIIALRL